MSKKKIDNPKVFISYAWGDKEYQEKVLAFASQLVSDGIDVVFDKWDLAEGNDTYAFMEKCANDESITNVLMLLDPVYAQKANEHTGGVGTETQIISPKVYQEVTQDKFIPIVFARNDKNEVCKPTYLQGRLHFDLSITEGYDETYQRLVKTLYGVEVYEKPELGKKPEWVEKKTVVAVRIMNEYESIHRTQNERERKGLFKVYLESIRNEITQVISQSEPMNLETDGVIAEYESFSTIRDRYLGLLKYTLYVNEPEKEIASFLEKTYQIINGNTTYRGSLGKTFLHELFLYTIAYFYKNEEYKATGYILGKSYFDSKTFYRDDGVKSYEIFYSGTEELFDRAMKSRDNKNYLSGEAAYWIEHLDSGFCTKEIFVLADLICYNYSIYSKDYRGWKWFPLTYIYDNHYSSCIRELSQKLISCEFVLEVLPLFGWTSIDDFKGKILAVEEERKKGMFKKYRFNESFEDAAIIGDYIKPDKIGTHR